MTIPTAEQCCGNCRNWRQDADDLPPGLLDPSNYGVCCAAPPRAETQPNTYLPILDNWPPTSRRRWCAQWEPSEHLMPTAEAQLRAFLDASAAMGQPGADLPPPVLSASVRQQLEALTYDDEPPAIAAPPLPGWANDPFDDPLS